MTTIGDITMALIVVTRNYQITLSKDIREELKLAIGERMISKVENNKIVLERLTKSPIRSAFGIRKTKKTGTLAVREMRSKWRA